MVCVYVCMYVCMYDFETRSHYVAQSLELSMETRLASNSQILALCLLNAGVKGMQHYAGHLFLSRSCRETSVDEVLALQAWGHEFCLQTHIQMYYIYFFTLCACVCVHAATRVWVL